MKELWEKLILTEKTRQQLIAKSQKSDSYSQKNQGKGKNRWERRVHSTISQDVSQYNNIDMNAFFKKDVLIVGVHVQGETNNYIVKVRFDKVLEEIRRAVQENNNELEFKVISQAISRSFSKSNVYVSCTCKDWCLEQNTKIKLLNGEIITVKELCERFATNPKGDFYVYSTDANGDFKPGKVNDVWVSGYSSDMIKVTLDNGKEIITTPNHKYMLRDGSYLEAEKLVVGQSLMPLYFRYNNGYESVKSNSENITKYYSVYKQVAKELLSTEIEQAKIRSGEEVISIHHSDFNKLNNYPSNLKPMGRLEHWNYHASIVKESGVLEKFLEAGKKYWATSEAREKQSEVMREVMQKYYANITPEEMQRIKDSIYTDEWREKISKAHKNLWENYSEEEYNTRVAKMRETTLASGNKISESLKTYYSNLSETDKALRYENASRGIKESWKTNRENHLTDKFLQARKNAFNYERTPEIERKRNITKIGNVIQKIIDNNKIPSPDTYEEFRTSGYPKYTKYFNSWEEVSEYFKLNHKVIKVETIHYDDPIPVYDISVGTYNNFYVDAGVVLHNCYRQAYWSTSGRYNSGQFQYSNGKKIANPHNTKGGGCKHINLILDNLSWVMKVATVVYNYIKYAETHMKASYERIIVPAIYGQQNLFKSYYKLPGGRKQSDRERQSRILGRANKEAETQEKEEPTTFTKPTQEPNVSQGKQMSLFDNEEEEEGNEINQSI